MKRTLIAGAWLLAVPFPAAAQAPFALSRDSAIALALAHNPALVVARAQVAQARARVTEASAFPDPTLSADWSGLSGPLRFGSRTGADVGVGLTVPFPQKFWLQGAAANGDLHAAQFGYEQLRQQTAAETAQAYDALLVALRHRTDLEQARALAEGFLQRTQARFEGGTVARIDVIKARVDLAQAENDLIANERDLANARSGLNRQLGRMLRLPVDPTDSLAVPGPIEPLDSLVAVALASRPELRALASQRAGARAATALAQQYFLPDLGLSMQKNIAYGSPNSWTVGVGVSVPLFFWNHQRGEVAEARQREQELAASDTDLRAQVEQDVRTAWASADAAIRQATYLRDQLLPEAQRAYDIVAHSYALGGSSALDVLDAKRTLLDALTQNADALGAANDAVYQLRLATGDPVPPEGAVHVR